MPIGTSTPPGAPPGPEAAARDDELWRALTTRLAVFVRRRIGEPYAAEDVAQELLLRLHRNLGELRAHDRLDAFAYRIARNAIIDHYRATATATELVSAPDDLIARIDAEGGIGAELDAVASAHELVRCLEPAVRRLPERYREALMLTDLGELSQVQAATIAGLSIPGMKARVQRGRAQLHELLTGCCHIVLDDDRHITDMQRRGPCACAPEEA